MLAVIIFTTLSVVITHYESIYHEPLIELRNSILRLRNKDALNFIVTNHV